MKDLRDKIDKIDEKIIELFDQRMDLAKEVVEAKIKIKRQIYDSQREEEIILKLKEKSKYQPGIERLYRTIFSISKSLQSQSLPDTDFEKNLIETYDNRRKSLDQGSSVAVAGLKGSFGDICARKIFKDGEIFYGEDFESVFKRVKEGVCEFGILPIENSTYGSVNEVYDLMTKFHFSIVAEHKLLVNQCLLAKKGTRLEDVREVISHNQALGQSSEFLKGKKDIELTPFKNTALAADHVKNSDRKDLACIASLECEEIFGLNILEENIQNTEINYTRFIVISKNMEVYENANKISIILDTGHRPGALNEVMIKFAALNLNLTKLESRPIAGRDFEFIFYFDFEGSIGDSKVRKHMADLMENSKYFSYLGNYVEV